MPPPSPGSIRPAFFADTFALPVPGVVAVQEVRLLAPAPASLGLDEKRRPDSWTVLGFEIWGSRFGGWRFWLVRGFLNWGWVRGFFGFACGSWFSALLGLALRFLDAN